MTKAAERTPQSTIAQEIDLSAIAISKTNPRKNFNKEKMTELVDSVSRFGVLQPVLVRPITGVFQNNGHRYELVAGERRYRAAKQSSLNAIPAVVREMDDREMLEIQITENLQRTDLHPLEEAEGYRLLTEKHGYSVEDLAIKVGKSKAYVYGRLKLCALSKPAQKVFYSEELNPSIALLVARIPDAKLQQEALKHIMRGPLSYRDAQEYIQENFMLRLSQASFKASDADLDKKAGPCTTCPKRTGNQGELFPDIKSADVCTDPVCFKRKDDFQWAKTQKEAPQKGLETLADEKSKRFFPEHHNGIKYDAPYVDLKASCYEDSKFRNYKTLFKKNPPKIILARDRSGKVHELVKKSDIPQALEACGYDFSKKNSACSAQESARRKKEALKAKIENEVSQLAMEQIVSKVESLGANEKILKILSLGMIHRAWAETVKKMVQRRDLEVLITSSYGTKQKDYTKTAYKYVESLSGKKRLGVLAELLIGYGLDGYGHPSSLKESAKVLGVDVGKIGREVNKELKVRKTSKSKNKKARKK